MFYTEELIQDVVAEPILGVIRICDMALDALNEGGREWTEQEYEILLETSALLETLMDSGVIDFQFPIPTLQGNIGNDCSEIMTFVRKAKEHFLSHHSLAKHQKAKARFGASLGSRFHYEFSQGDLEKVQNLINQLRQLVASSNLLDEEHRLRILKRLETLQSELHKKMSDLDRFWGLVGEAGVILGKFGDNAKPLVDRIKDIAQIVWQTQSRAEELPSGTPVPTLEYRNQNEEV